MKQIFKHRLSFKHRLFGGKGCFESVCMRRVYIVQQYCSLYLFNCTSLHTPTPTELFCRSRLFDRLIRGTPFVNNFHYSIMKETLFSRDCKLLCRSDLWITDYFRHLHFKPFQILDIMCIFHFFCRELVSQEKRANQ